jgi:hypothetical protein
MSIMFKFCSSQALGEHQNTDKRGELQGRPIGLSEFSCVPLVYPWSSQMVFATTNLLGILNPSMLIIVHAAYFPSLPSHQISQKF